MFGESAKKLFDDAQEMVQDLVNNKKIKATGIYGIFMCQANSQDDIEIFDPQNESNKIAKLHTLRQQVIQENGIQAALSDFIHPDKQDFIGMFAVTAGLGAEELCKEFQSDHDDYKTIMLKALADRFAEAFAEKLHQDIRKEIWGYAKEE